MLLILIFNFKKNKLYSNGFFVIMREMTLEKKKNHGRWDTKFDTFFFFSAEWEQSFDILGQIY